MGSYAVLSLRPKYPPGNKITRSKPDPEVFLLAASKLRVPAEDCAAVEDAEAGIRAAKAAGMKAVGIGFAENDTSAQSLEYLSAEELLR